MKSNQTLKICLLVFVFLLAFSIGAQISQARIQYENDQLNNPETIYLQENYGVGSIEEYRLKLEQETWLNYTKTIEELYANQSKVWDEWTERQSLRNPTLPRYGTSTFKSEMPQQNSWMPFVNVGNPFVMLSVFSLSGFGFLTLTITPLFKKHKKLKFALIVCAVSLVVFSVGFFAGQVYAQSSSRDIWLDDLPSTASYVINTDGAGNYWATRYDDKIAFSGTDAATVIQAALDALTAGRTWEEKVACKGNFTLTSVITTPSYVALNLRKAKLTLNAGVNDHMFENSDAVGGNTDITVLGGHLYGDGANQVPIRSYDIFHFDNVARLKILNTICENANHYGIGIKNCSYALIQGNECFTDETYENDDGIEVQRGSHHTRVIGNYCHHNHKNGIEIEEAGRCVVVANITKDNHVGIQVDGTASYLASQTVIVGNNCYDKMGIAIFTESDHDDYDCVIAYNVCEANAETTINDSGIYVEGAWHRVLIADNIIKDFGKHGIYLCSRWSDEAKYASAIKVIGNIVVNPQQDYGIRVSATSADGIYDIYVDNNLLIDCPNGIIVENARDIDVKGNAFVNSTTTDLRLEATARTVLVEANHFTHATLQIQIIAGATYTIRRNVGYVTENSGTATIANNEWVPHGLATTPTVVTVTTRTATYGGVAVIVGWVGQNATHFQVSAYWTNSTAITDDAINISWYAEV